MSLTKIMYPNIPQEGILINDSLTYNVPKKTN
jgi:hypothetical protein